jgi:hypothetical protein
MAAVAQNQGHQMCLEGLFELNPQRHSKRNRGRLHGIATRDHKVPKIKRRFSQHFDNGSRRQLPTLQFCVDLPEERVSSGFF